MRNLRAICVRYVCRPDHYGAQLVACIRCRRKGDASAIERFYRSRRYASVSAVHRDRYLAHSALERAFDRRTVERVRDITELRAACARDKSKPLFGIALKEFCGVFVCLFLRNFTTRIAVYQYRVRPVPERERNPHAIRRIFCERDIRFKRNIRTVPTADYKVELAAVEIREDCKLFARIDEEARHLICFQSAVVIELHRRFDIELIGRRYPAEFCKRQRAERITVVRWCDTAVIKVIHELHAVK